jgi:hypothetical protein
MADASDLDQALTYEEVQTGLPMDFRKAAQNPCRNRHDTCQIQDPSRSAALPRREQSHAASQPEASLRQRKVGRRRSAGGPTPLAEPLRSSRLIGLPEQFMGPQETAFMRHVLKPGDGIVDAGANIGWFSLAEQCVGATGRIYAFEPQPRVFRYLQRTVEENGLIGQIHVFDYALSDSQTNAMLMWDPAGGNIGRTWLATPDQRGTELDARRVRPVINVWIFQELHTG